MSSKLCEFISNHSFLKLQNLRQCASLSYYQFRRLIWDLLGGHWVTLVPKSTLSKRSTMARIGCARRSALAFNWALDEHCSVRSFPLLQSIRFSTRNVTPLHSAVQFRTGNLTRIEFAKAAQLTEHGMWHFWFHKFPTRLLSGTFLVALVIGCATDSAKSD